MIYWINDIWNKKQRIPFSKNKDAVIIGRGRINRDRFLFRLENVNLFFLNHKPPKWAINYYKKKYPKIYKKSLFIFLHGAHLNDLLSVFNCRKLSILTWPGKKLPGLKTNNVSSAAMDFVGQALCGKNIYISAFDFTDDPQWVFTGDGKKRKWVRQGRDWPKEASFLGQVMWKHNNNVFQFITFNKYFEKKSGPPPQEIVDFEFDDKQIEINYLLSGTELEPEPGDLLRKALNN